MIAGFKELSDIYVHTWMMERSLTGQHALVDDARSRHEHRVALHRAAVTRHLDDVTRHEVFGRNVVPLCKQVPTPTSQITLTQKMTQHLQKQQNSPSVSRHTQTMSLAVIVLFSARCI